MGGAQSPELGNTAPMQEKVSPIVASPSDDDLFASLIRPEAVALADTVIRIARLLNARERAGDVLDPGQ